MHFWVFILGTWIMKLLQLVAVLVFVVKLSACILLNIAIAVPSRQVADEHGWDP